MTQRTRDIRRLRLSVLPVALVLSLGALIAPLGPSAPGPVAAATDRLPDLRMAKLSEFRIVVSNGRRLMRFSSTMTNLGAGPFEIRATRTSTSSAWNIDQVIYDDAGGSRRIDTTATMQYGGDGHGHWHVNRMVDIDLWSSTRHARGAKVGYCFFDTSHVSPSLARSPASPVYRESMCARLSGLSNRVGISVGWGDRYQYSLPFQWVDVTGLPAGDYYIRGMVDARNLFTESSNTNNCTYTKIRFSSSGSTVTVLASGSTCINDWSAGSYAADIAWAFDSGFTSGCGVNLFCPADKVTRGEMATWVARAFDLPATATDYFTDDETSPNEADINRIAAAGITSGCGGGRYCPTTIASRGELAAFITRALHLPPAPADYYTDDETSIYEPSINAIAAAGIAAGCGSGVYCPTAAVLRAPLAAFLHRALD
jgi:lysyl oxidase/S-layer family protein